MTFPNPRSIPFAFLLGAILLTTPGLASASGGFGAHLGYAKASDAEDGNGTVGAHVELGLLSFLGLQGSLDYRLVESLSVATGGQDYELNIRSVPLTVTARLYAPLRVRPFVALGAGWYYLIYDYSNELEGLGFVDEEESSFGWHVGAGLEVPVSSKVSVYGEGRAVFVDPDKDLNQATVEEIKAFDYDSVYFAGGLTVHF